MINRETKKYEHSIIIADGVLFYGLSDLILLKGTMKEFAYVQVLEYYKEKFDEFIEQNKNFLLEQDGASCHISKKSKVLINEFFGDQYIQNSPHSQNCIPHRNFMGWIKTEGKG